MSGPANRMGVALVSLSGRFDKLAKSATAGDRASKISTSMGPKGANAISSSAFPGINSSGTAPGSDLGKTMARHDAAALNDTKRAADAASRALNAYAAAKRKAEAGTLGTARATMGKTGANTGGLQQAPINVNPISALLGKLAQISPRAAQAGSSLLGMASRANDATASLGGLSGIAGKVGGALMSVGAFALKAAAVVAAAFVAMGGAAARYIGQMQALKSSTLFAFGAMMGGQKQAAAGWDKMAASAVKIGVPLDEMSKAMTGLMAQGFAFDEADRLVKRMADLKAINPGANLEKIALAISQIKAKGKLSQEELGQQLAETGLSPDMVYEALAKKLGKDKGQIMKMISAGQIDAKTGIAAIEEAMAQQTGGGAAGALAEKFASTTILGGIGRLQARIQKFAAGLKIDFAPAAKFLDRIGLALEGEGGIKFGKALENGLNTAIGLLDNISQKDLEGVFEKAATAINTMASGAKSLGGMVKTIDGWLASAGSKTSTFGLAVEVVRIGLFGVLDVLRWAGTLLDYLGGAASFFGSMFNTAKQTITLPFIALIAVWDGIVASITAASAALDGFLAKVGMTSAIKMPDLTNTSLLGAASNDNATTQPETPEQIIKRVSEANQQREATTSAAEPQATKTQVSVDVEVAFNTPMFEARVREIAQEEIAA